MNERELRDALRDAAPEDGDARQRAWRVVQAAYEEHEPRMTPPGPLTPGCSYELVWAMRPSAQRRSAPWRSRAGGAP